VDVRRDRRLSCGADLPELPRGTGARADRPVVPSDIVVVLDACRDASPAVAGASGFRALCSDARNVGAARRAGFDPLVAERGPLGLWLATTDADSPGCHRAVSRVMGGRGLLLPSRDVVGPRPHYRHPHLTSALY
jgi:hypothetical protein